MRTVIVKLLGVTLLLQACGCAAEQSNFQPTLASTRQAILRGEAKEAQTALEAQALEAERKGQWRAASDAYRNAAYASGTNGQYQKAISYANKALATAEKSRDLWRQAGAINYLARNYRLIRQHDVARAWLQRGLEIAKQIVAARTQTFYEGVFLRELGANYLEDGKPRQAIPYLIDSLERFDETLASYKLLSAAEMRRVPDAIPDTQSMKIGTLYFLGRAKQAIGESDEAIKTYENAIEVANESRFGGERLLSIYSGLGSLYQRQKNLIAAQEYLNKALVLAEKQAYPAFIRSASAQLGHVLEQAGKPSEAIPYYKKSIDSIESTRSLLKSEEFRSTFFESARATYVSMIRVQLRSDKSEEAFNYAERARSRAFLDILGSKVELSRSGTLMEQERALQARISVLRAMTEARDGDAAEITDLRKQLAEAQKAYDDYLAQVRKENKEQASLMNVEPLTLKEVQERLDPDTTMLEYFVSRNNVWLWVVEKDRMEFVSTAISRKDLVSKVTELRDTIYQLGEKERFNILSQELQELLIQPALPHIHGKELIIVPHDVLHYLPFQALLDSDGHYLIEKYPIYYLSSASLLQFTQEKRRAMGDKVLALGNPDLGDPKMNLQFAEVEAKQIQSLYPQSTVLLEKEATEEKAKSLSPENDILHFATHAELKEDDPLASAILLAKSDKEDGRLEVREIFGMNLKASLVVLSACETGLGKLSSGDDLVGLTRAFIYAGTPSVVASLWNVEDSSTAQLMASFYKNLKTMTKVEALRQAQLNLIHGNVNSDLLARRGIGGVGKLGETPSGQLSALGAMRSAADSVSTSHPYFWAPFILVGDGK